MRAAVLVVGQMRTWSTCIHTFKWHIARQLNCDLDFYVSTVQDSETASADLIGTHFPQSKLVVEAKAFQPDLAEIPEPVRFEPYARSVPMQAVLRQLWQLNEAWRLFSLYDEGQYDFIIRTRPDLFFHSFKMPEDYPSDWEAWTPWWGRFGGLNDRFAIMGWRSAKAYFQTFQKLETLLQAGCPIHPESLIAGSIWEAGCHNLPRLKVEFSTLRMTGEMRPPEISPIDLAHAGMRNLTEGE